MEVLQDKPILFASDLTPEMRQVFHCAAIEALNRKTEIIILHVMEKNFQAEGQISTWFGKEKYRNFKTQNRKNAHSKLIGKDVEGHRIRMAIQGFFEEQEPVPKSPSLIKDILVTESPSIADTIIATTLDEGCGMIVMGCRQQGLISSAMGDHVVRRILQRSKVPVLLVPFEEK